jgi:Flp pilus assembly pilin Flp
LATEGGNRATPVTEGGQSTITPVMHSLQTQGGRSDQAGTRSRRPRRGGERGATLPEYGLIFALVVVVSIGAISFLEDRSRESLNARSDRAGNPDAAEAGNPGSGTGGTTGSSTGSSTGSGTSGPVAPSGVTVSSITGVATSTPPDWQATVTVIVRDDSNAVAPSVLITANWNPAVAGSTVSCTSDSNGRCIFSQKDMKANGGGEINQVTFTVTGLSFPSSSPPVTYTLPSPPPSVTVSKP